MISVAALVIVWLILVLVQTASDLTVNDLLSGDSTSITENLKTAKTDSNFIDNSRHDKLLQSFTANGYTSKYHLYAANLDWTRPVGVLIYADGSGEYGLENTTSDYLLAGGDGLVSVAKRHNMILLTPFSPNKNCSDGDGACWYLGDPVGYAEWLESLVESVQASYSYDRRRVVFAGYSSGAQLATEYWLPSGAAQRTMDGGLIVAISYGGSPKMSVTNQSSQFKSQVHLNWNTGALDKSYTTTSQYGVKAGYRYYSQAGFSTSIDVIPSLGHDRWGQFGQIIDSQIQHHVE